jgi:hypothetical protein
MENKLILFVEVSITVLAFSSIIFQVRTTSDPNFNGYAFMGIMIHGFLSLIFCCGTLVLMEMISNHAILFRNAGIILGVLTMLQVLAVFKNDRHSSLPMKMIMLVLATTIFSLQILSASIQPDFSGGYFLTAILYHIFMSLLLFMVMIFQVLDKKSN